jgi:hypothetical protein
MIRVHIVQFLEEGQSVSNEFSSVLPQAHPHAVVQLQHVAQVIHLGNPWQGNTIQKNWKNILPIVDMLGENETLSFVFIRVQISNKLQDPNPAFLKIRKRSSM